MECQSAQVPLFLLARQHTGECMPSDTPFRPGSLSQLPGRDATSATLAQHWWTIVLRGAVAIVFGIIALTAPGAVLLSLALVFGSYLMVDGIIGLIGAARTLVAHGHWGALMAEAVLNMIVGLAALFMPGAAVLGFVLLMAAWALISGALMVAAAIQLHISHGRWWLAAGGIASLIWGVLLLAAPLTGAVAVTWWLGVYAILFGAALLACGWQLRVQRVQSVIV